MGASGDIDAEWEDLISVVEALPTAPKPAVPAEEKSGEPAAPDGELGERPQLIEVGAVEAEAEEEAPAREGEQGIFGEIGEPAPELKAKTKGVRKRPSVVVAAVPRPSKVGVPEPVFETRPRPDPEPVVPAPPEPAKGVPTWGLVAAAVAIVAVVGVVTLGGDGEPEVQAAVAAAADSGAPENDERVAARAGEKRSQARRGASPVERSVAAKRGDPPIANAKAGAGAPAEPLVAGANAERPGVHGHEDEVEARGDAEAEGAGKGSGDAAPADGSAVAADGSGAAAGSSGDGDKADGSGADDGGVEGGGNAGVRGGEPGGAAAGEDPPEDGSGADAGGRKTDDGSAGDGGPVPRGEPAEGKGKGSVSAADGGDAAAAAAQGGGEPAAAAQGGGEAAADADGEADEDSGAEEAPKAAGAVLSVAKLAALDPEAMKALPTPRFDPATIAKQRTDYDDAKKRWKATRDNAAVEAMAMAACLMDDGAKARGAYRKVQGRTSRRRVFWTCKAAGVSLKYDQPGYSQVELIRHGRRKLAHGDAKAALELGRQANRMGRSDPAILLMGKAFCALGKLSGARKMLLHVNRTRKPELLASCREHGHALDPDTE